LFNAGIRPAINAGISVSRVGGNAQTKLIKKLGGGVRIALAQYRELAAFAQFASDLDAATRKQLERGRRVTELMKQKQYQPLTVAEMALSLFAVNEGFIDDVPANKVVDFEAALHAFARGWLNELKDRAIRVNVLHPGPIATPMQDQVLNEEAKRMFESLIPRGTMGRPEEIAAAALFLASDDSSFVNGVELSVDGGFSAI
jgi:F-type H+-transporting ATPase subunit alpha